MSDTIEERQMRKEHQDRVIKAKGLLESLERIAKTSREGELASVISSLPSLQLRLTMAVSTLWDRAD